MDFHLYLYQKSADFARSWVYGVKSSNFETHYHCSPENIVLKNGHPEKQIHVYLCVCRAYIYVLKAKH